MSVLSALPLLRELSRGEDGSGSGVPTHVPPPPHQSHAWVVVVCTGAVIAVLLLLWACHHRRRRRRRRYWDPATMTWQYGLQSHVGAHSHSRVDVAIHEGHRTWSAGASSPGSASHDQMNRIQGRGDPGQRRLSWEPDLLGAESLGSRISWPESRSSSVLLCPSVLLGPGSCLFDNGSHEDLEIDLHSLRDCLSPGDFRAGVSDGEAHRLKYGLSKVCTGDHPPQHTVVTSSPQYGLDLVVTRSQLLRRLRRAQQEQVALQLQHEPEIAEPEPEIEQPIVSDAHFSAFAPTEVQPELDFILEVHAFTLLVKDRVVAEVLERGKAAAGPQRGPFPIPVNHLVTVTVELPEDTFAVDECSDQFLWQGECGNASFAVRCLPGAQARRHLCQATIEVENATRVATLLFELNVVARNPISPLVSPSYTADAIEFVVSRREDAAQARASPRWVPDYEEGTCMCTLENGSRCNAALGSWLPGRTGKSHCRYCGWIVCAACLAPERLALDRWVSSETKRLKFGAPRKLKKVCKSCFTAAPMEISERAQQSSEPTCPAMVAAKSFVATLNLGAAFLDARYNRCYCPTCYPAELADVEPAREDISGSDPYVIPRGWVGFGLQVPPRAVSLDIFNAWSVAFHGVDNQIVLKSVLDCGQLMKAGDALLDGTLLQSSKCAGRQDNVFYTSPTIQYAGLKFYATPHAFVSEQLDPESDGLAAQMVLQCRQKPCSFTRQGETMGFEANWPGYLPAIVGPHLDLDSIELMSRTNVAAIPYRLLVRTFHPSEDVDHYVSPLDRPRRSCPTERRSQEQPIGVIIDHIASAQAHHMAAEPNTPRLPEF
jgi:hypothetical protein|eukprot:COSAG01_NODE_3268_length_6330_cov_85.930348_7_plen_829_part_00